MLKLAHDGSNDEAVAEMAQQDACPAGAACSARVRGLSVGYGAAAVYWALVGAMGAFGLAGILTIGIFVIAGTVALILLAIALQIDRRAAPAALIGAGAVPLVLAWINRSGPGTFCERTANSITCSEQYNPWPFMAAAVVLIAVGGTVLIGVRRRARHAPLPDPPYPPIDPR